MVRTRRPIMAILKGEIIKYNNPDIAHMFFI